MRRYEYHMSRALQAYATSVSQAKEVELEGGLIAEQNGGSSHGAVEAVHRLHASRLKCLISGVYRKEDEREIGELEAFRLTEVIGSQIQSREQISASAIEYGECLGRQCRVLESCCNWRCSRRCGGVLGGVAAK